MSVNIPLNRHTIGFPYLKGNLESQVIQSRNERDFDPAYTPCLMRVFQTGTL
jgi:hypothetical protein